MTHFKKAIGYAVIGLIVFGMILGKKCRRL